MKISRVVIPKSYEDILAAYQERIIGLQEALIILCNNGMPISVLIGIFSTLLDRKVNVNERGVICGAITLLIKKKLLCIAEKELEIPLSEGSVTCYVKSYSTTSEGVEKCVELMERLSLQEFLTKRR